MIRHITGDQVVDAIMNVFEDHNKIPETYIHIRIRDMSAAQIAKLMRGDRS